MPRIKNNTITITLTKEEADVIGTLFCQVGGVPELSYRKCTESVLEKILQAKGEKLRDFLNCYRYNEIIKTMSFREGYMSFTRLFR